MRIIVCIKQVPDTKDVRLDPQTNTMAREGVASIMNPYDRHALEAGVRLREAAGGTVTALSMGPPQAEATLREAVACGADEAVLVSDRAFAGADTWATTYTLAATIRHLGGADVVLCGKQAIDGDTAQVGPGLAERLDMPFVSYARRLELAEGGLRLERVMDDGYDEVLAPLPCLVTVVREINEPRLPSLKGKMRAAKLAIPRLAAADLGADPASCGLAGSFTQVVRVFAPSRQRQARMLDGSPQEQVAALVACLRSSIG
ncbi:MAG: electron transfer flavoprotein subunit beta/FixA family protein [Thermodesulfobacteriota bacterium]